MLFMRKTTALPSAAEALPGRATPIPTATTHFVNGRRLQPPYPAGLEQAVFGLGCFWGAERKFWELGEGIYSTSVGYAGGHTANPTYEEVCSGRTGHTEVVQVVFDPKKISYEALLKTFWENHNPTQGMRQGNDVGTQYRSAIYTFGDAQTQSRGCIESDLSKGTGRQGPWRHHHRNRAVRRVLFCRGLPSAISRQESGRLLRIGRHRGVLPDRRRRHRLIADFRASVLIKSEPGLFSFLAAFSWQESRRKAFLFCRRKNPLLTITGARLGLSRLRDGSGASCARVSTTDHCDPDRACSVRLHAHDWTGRGSAATGRSRFHGLWPD